MSKLLFLFLVELIVMCSVSPVSGDGVFTNRHVYHLPIVTSLLATLFPGLFKDEKVILKQSQKEMYWLMTQI